jgi:hypothetical protein
VLRLDGRWEAYQNIASALCTLRATSLMDGILLIHMSAFSSLTRRLALTLAGRASLLNMCSVSVIRQRFRVYVFSIKR